MQRVSNVLLLPGTLRSRLEGNPRAHSQGHSSSILTVLYSCQDTTLLRERTQALGSVEERERGEAELLNIKEEVRHICSETAKGFLVSYLVYHKLPSVPMVSSLFGEDAGMQ